MEVKSISLDGQPNAVSLAPHENLAAVGGRDKFVIASVENYQLFVKKNMRSKRSNLDWSCNDIKWHPRDNRIATAAYNSQIMLWDIDSQAYTRPINKNKMQHDQTVNRICWIPRDEFLDSLLSGSQDGKVIHWDLRIEKPAGVYDCRSPVRDLQFSHLNPFYFATCLENGQLIIWDVRKTDAVRKTTAHTEVCMTLQWHPTVKTCLCTGSRNKSVKVWNINELEEPTHSIQTMSSVSRVVWRPGYVHQLATCASLFDNAISIWDLNRPYVPLGRMSVHKDVISDFSFSKLDPTQILSCAKDCTLRWSQIQKSVKLPHSTLPTCSIGWNVYGNIASVSHTFDRDEINQWLFAPPVFTPQELPQMPTRPLNTGTGTGTNTNTNTSATPSASATSTPAALPATFTPALSSPSTRSFASSSQLTSSQSITRTFPSTSASFLSAASDARSTWSKLSGRKWVRCIHHNSISKSNHESDAVGFDAEAFTYLARHYKLEGLPVSELCTHNQKVAEQCSSFQLSKVWEMVGILFNMMVQEQLSSSISAEPAPTSPSSTPSSRQVTTTTSSSSSSSSSSTTSTPTYQDPLGLYDDDPFVGGGGDFLSDWLDDDFGVVSEISSNKGSRAELLNDHDDVWNIAADPEDDTAATVGTRNAATSSTDENGQRSSTATSVSTSSTIAAASAAPTAAPTAATTGTNTSRPTPSTNTTTTTTTTTTTATAATAAAAATATTTSSSRGKRHANSMANRKKHQPALNDHVLAAPSKVLDPKVILTDLLNYHGDRGDIQTCVVVSLVLGSHCPVSTEQLGKWQFYYMEQLHRLQLFVEMNSFILLSSDEVTRNQNRINTTVYSMCPKCGKPMPGASWFCQNCFNIASECGICHNPVKGLYAWCQGCGHGGHLTHLTDWFIDQKHSKCPTGCGHSCTIPAITAPSH